MTNLRTIARALGGDVAGPDKVLVPGPGHSPKDRSLSVRLDPRAPDGFVTYSHAGDDWRICRDHVRTLLGLPEWQPGDGRRRTIPQQHVEKWDFAAITTECDEDRVWSKRELSRMASAREVWEEARDPRRTLAETYLREQRGLDLPDNLA